MTQRLLQLLFCAVTLASCGRVPEPWQGYIEGEFVYLSSPTAGFMASVDAPEGSEVAVGAAVCSLDTELENTARQEVAERMAAAASIHALAKENLARASLLIQKKAISAQEFDEAVKTHSSTLAELQAARAALDQADWRLRHMTLRSSEAATVHDIYYRPGEWVPAGSPVVSVLPPSHWKVRFYLPQDASPLPPGSTVQVSCDGLSAPLPARVLRCSEQVEFTPPVIYSTEARQKLSFLVEAACPPEVVASLRVGQPVSVTR